MAGSQIRAIALRMSYTLFESFMFFPPLIVVCFKPVQPVVGAFRAFFHTSHAEVYVLNFGGLRPHIEFDIVHAALDVPHPDLSAVSMAVSRVAASTASFLAVFM